LNVSESFSPSLTIKVIYLVIEVPQEKTTKKMYCQVVFFW